MTESLNKLLEKSIKKNWNNPALTNYKSVTIHYRDVARKIEKMHIVFKMCGLQKGDKVAICGKNQANWGVVFLATLTYGAVPVPLLNEFTTTNIYHLVNHSDARLFFVGDMIWEGLSQSEMPNIEAIILLSDLSLLYSDRKEINNAFNRLNELFGKRYPKNFGPNDISYYKDTPDELAMINYTSGTTGFSKGVMLSYKSLLSNVYFAREVEPHMNSRSNCVSMLPTAHMYGFLFEFLFEMIIGAHVHFLTRLPTPKVLLDAFAEVKPDIIISVPMVIEKIYKKRLEPLLEKGSLKLLMNVPVIDQKIYKKIDTALCEAFGGKFEEVIIGGAAFNKEAETFFKKIGFRYTVGYGMTECGPIICYAHWNEHKLHSCGRIVPRMQLKINSSDPHNVPGEILVKGDNVMMGYYKNEEATKAVLTEDGWLKTGDLGVVDEDGFLFIRGRSKTMILGPSGQNIYPEEIESGINNLPYVIESLVISVNNKLVALIYPDEELASSDGLDLKALKKNLEKNVAELNQMSPSYLKVNSIELMPEEFAKTPKRSIKRYLYQRNN